VAGDDPGGPTRHVIRLGHAAMPENNPKVFRADRPFVFGIVDRETGLSVFLGRVTDPSTGAEKAAR